MVLLWGVFVEHVQNVCTVKLCYFWHAQNRNPDEEETNSALSPRSYLLNLYALPLFSIYTPSKRVIITRVCVKAMCFWQAGCYRFGISIYSQHTHINILLVLKLENHFYLLDNFYEIHQNYFTLKMVYFTLRFSNEENYFNTEKVYFVSFIYKQ